MLNAYGRVDKGRLFPLDRGDDRNSAFGTTIGDTYEHFKNIQKSQDVIRNKNPSPKNSTKNANKNSSLQSEKSVVVSDTLLSNLLINSVLSALRKGKRFQ